MRDPRTGWIQLSSAEFFLIWTAAGLGERIPPVLDIEHLGRTPARRAEYEAAASQALADRDLGTVADPAPDLAGVLQVLAEPDVSLDLRAYGAGAPLYGFAATGGAGAAVAARVDGEVRLGIVRDTALAQALLGSLPAETPGSGRPANISVADYERACQEGAEDGVSGFTRVLHEAGVRPPEASTVAQALITRRGGGQLGASARGRHGRTIRTPSIVSWLDTAEGRYALRRHGEWISITPVDLPRLASMADEMLESVR